MDKLTIPTIAKQEFMSRLQNKTIEDVSAVETVESFFRKKRGYVFRLPKPGTPVIHLVSGGIESTVLWGLMLEKYQLCVYPLFLRRGADRWKKEWKAVAFFSKFYRARYPELFREPYDMELNVVSPKIAAVGRNPYHYHPERILDNYQLQTGMSTIFSQGGFPIAYPMYGLSYASYLWDYKNIKVNFFFSGVAPGDGDFVVSQTFAALRTTMLTMCIASANDGLQFGSLAFEKEYGLWLEKKDLILLGARMGLPLEQTWSCYRAGIRQCGDRCLTCYYRRSAFAAAGVPDQTRYGCGDAPEKVKRWVERAWRRLTEPPGQATVEEETTWKREEVKIPWKKSSKQKSRIKSPKTKK